MADEKDKRVAGPAEQPAESRQEPPPGDPHAVAGHEHGGIGTPGAEPAPPASPPPPPSPPGLPQPPPPPRPPFAEPVPPPGEARHRDFGWARRRSVQLVAAGIAGAILGGGAVALLDLLDDRGEHRYVRFERGPGPYGPGPKRWYGPDWNGEEQGEWPPRWQQQQPFPRRVPPMPGVPQEPTAPPLPSPSPSS
ncbi:hypothetical protein [Actinomadura alba]|uniref:Uncharacterized protein n=1 Tax=Actinomadura alba TaxID=406431 RepID=A0ABR7LLX8_9ACTN|nr:hypothetical protein [Actinomadura alba]MBC6465403.1 hypothetical protein [Actinomadura alba]